MQNPSEDNSKKTPLSGAAKQWQLIQEDLAELAAPSPPKASLSSFDKLDEDEIDALSQGENPAESVEQVQYETTPEQQKIDADIQEATKKLVDVLQMTWPPRVLDASSNITSDANTPYQLFLDTSKNHPHSLLLIADSQTNHESLDGKLDTLAKFLREIILAQFFPEHDIESFKDKSFANYVTRIELNEENLDTLLTCILPPVGEIKVYLENYRKELLVHNSTHNKECKQILFDSLSSQDNIVSDDLNHILQTLEQGKASIGFIQRTVDIANLGSKTDLDRARDILMEYYISVDCSDFQPLSTAHLNRFQLVKRLNDTSKIIIRLNINESTDYNGIVKAFYLLELEKQYPALKESAAMIQIEKNLRYANQLTTEHETYCDDFLAKYYQAKFRDKKAQEIRVTLNVCRGYNEKYAIHQSINTLYIQCKISYLLNDPFRLSALQAHLIKLVESVISRPHYSAEIIMEKIGFYAGGDYYVNHKAGQRVNPAWEYGLCIQPADQELLAFYKNHLGKEVDGIEGFISISLVNLALFYLLDFMNTSEKTTQYFQALQIAANLIKQYDLIVPSAYKQRLFSSGHFSDAEKEQLEQRYKNRYQEELNKAKSASQALGWEDTFNQEVVVCSSSMFKQGPNSKDEQLKNLPMPCSQPSSLTMTPL